jgi:aspartate beta-hydroxylase
MMAVTSNETPGVTPISAQDAFERALTLHQQNQLSEAEALYNRALSLHPDHAGALCHLGLMRLQQGKAEESVTILRRAVAQNPLLAEAHNYLGAALQRLGALSEAEALYDRALSLHPDHADTLLHLGMLRLQEGKVQESATLLRRAIAQDPESAQAHNYLGAALQRLAAHDEALACHDKALALAPDYSDALLARAGALQALGRAAEAITCYEMVLAKAPDNAQAQLGLATVLEASGRHEDAFVRYRNAASLDPRLSEHLGKAVAAYGQRHQAVAQAGMQRMNLYIGSFLTNQGNPRMASYPGLSSAPFHDAARFPIALALEQSYEAIRSEMEGLAATEFQPEIDGVRLTQRGTWDVFPFYERGSKNVENCARCPVITRIIDGHNTVRTLAGLLYVSKLSPGTHLKPHRGPTNLRLRCHLGITIPHGDCALKVGGETRHWQEGRCIVFDDSFEHEAWNHTSEPRVVLIIDLWHPDLAPVEIAFLEGLHRFAAYHAVSLNHYWSANAEARSKSRKHYD